MMIMNNLIDAFFKIFHWIKNTEYLSPITINYNSKYKNQRPLMEFKAKIKSMTQHSIRGTRLIPPQLITTDSNKNIQAPNDLSNGSITKNPQSFAQEPQTEVSRFNNRHTTQIGVNRPTVTRLSLEQISKNRSSELQEGSQGNLSGRHSVFQLEPQSKLQKSAGEEKTSQVLLKKFLMENNQFNAFKDLRIQKITSNQTKMDRSLYENYNRKTEQTQERFSPTEQKQAKLEISSTKITHTDIWQKLYHQYKDKYNSLQKDNLQLIAKMKDAEYEIQRLTKDKDQFKETLQNCQKLQNKVEEQDKRILKLEQSIRINRNINELLMKKERESQNKLRLLEEKNEATLKEKIEKAKNQAILEATQKHDETIRIYEKEIFELKLKLIDQVNQSEENNRQRQLLHASLNQQKSQLHQQVQCLNSQRQSMLRQFTAIKQQLESRCAEIAALYSQNNNLHASICQRNEQITKLTAEIIRIDQQGMRLDSQNLRLHEEYQCEVATLNERLNFTASQCSVLERQKDQLIDQLQNKEAQLAQLNISRNNAFLEILELKNSIKIRRQEQATQKKQNQIQLQRLKIVQNDLKLAIQNKNEELSQVNREISTLQSTSMAQKIQFEETIKKLLQQNLQLKNSMEEARQQHERNVSEKWKQNEELMNESLVFKLQMLESLKNITEENKELHEKQRAHQKNIQQLRLNNERLQQQNLILEQLMKSKTDTILKLNDEINQFQKLQIERVETLKYKQSEISSRQNQLKEVQQQYLELIEGELKKIQSINDNQWDDVDLELNRFQSSPTRANNEDYLEEGLSPRQTPKKGDKEYVSSPEEQKIQAEIAELTIRVEELTFVNQALNQKVEQLSQLQEHSNEIIMMKIKAFEENLQRTLHQKNEVDCLNAQLHHSIAELTQKCTIYESRVEWLDNMYRQLQANLFETQQQLLKSHFQYINLKLMTQLQQQEQDQHQKQGEIQDIYFTSTNPLIQEVIEIQKQKSESENKDSSEELLLDSSNQQQILQQEAIMEEEDYIDQIYNEQQQKCANYNYYEPIIEDIQQHKDEETYPPQSEYIQQSININIISVSSEDSLEKDYCDMQINVILAPSDEESEDTPSYHINVMTVHSEDQSLDEKPEKKQVKQCLLQQKAYENLAKEQFKNDNKVQQQEDNEVDLEQQVEPLVDALDEHSEEQNEGLPENVQDQIKNGTTTKQQTFMNQPCSYLEDSGTPCNLQSSEVQFNQNQHTQE